MTRDSSPRSPIQNIQQKECYFNFNFKRIKFFLPWMFLISFVFLLSLTYSPDILTAPHRLWLGGEKSCDLFDGKWVRDYARMMNYNNRSCKTIPESKNCAKYGKDQDFVNWRWKPNGCDLPRFNGKKFLSIVRGKRMAFVGDSVSRNQMESLLCLLSQVETPIDIEEKDPEDRFRTWYFRSHDFILTVLWTKFLVVGSERTLNGSTTRVYDLHLDKIDTTWTRKLPWFNYLVISDGHWYFRTIYLYENNELIGCVYCSDKNVANLGPTFAARRAFKTALHFIDNCKNCKGMVTIVRTFSPSHFENGQWNGGGYCNRTSPTSRRDVSIGGTEWEMRGAQLEEMEKIGRGGNFFRVLDVTKAMMMRADAHPGSHWNNEWMKGYNDCVHWCMPGPVDVWNELLLQLMS